MKHNETQQQARWLTIPMAAKRISMSPNYLRQMVLDGRVPAGIAHRPIPGGHWRIDIEALDEWMQNGCFTVSPGETGGGADAS